MTQSKGVYAQIIEEIFARFYRDGISEFSFTRDLIPEIARKLNLEEPKNIGDVIYNYRYRAKPLEVVAKTQPDGYEWIIRPNGISRYRFALAKKLKITPTPNLVETKILDATPGIIAKYALNDEQALLAKVRYNRLIDIFTGLTCYSLQNHLRTKVESVGQVETDELYVGVDKRGAHYIMPVEAKGRNEKIGRVQIEQDFDLCAEKFTNVVSLPIAAQFVKNNLIALFAFELSGDEISIAAERHYRLVNQSELSDIDLANYQSRLA